MNCEDKNALPGYVYFRDNGMDYKFGITNNPTRRGRDYKTENPRDTVIDCFMTDTYAETEAVEAEMKQAARSEGLCSFDNSEEWIKRDDKSLAFWDRFSKKYARRTYEEWLDIHIAESPCLRNSILNRLRDEVLRNDDLNDLVEKFDSWYEKLRKLGIYPTEKEKGCFSLVDVPY